MAEFFNRSGESGAMAIASGNSRSDEFEAAQRTREGLVAALDRAIAGVSAQITALKAQVVDDEAASEVEELEGQLRMLDQQRERVEQAPAGSLGTLKMDVSAGLTATRIASDGAAGRGFQQVVQHVVDMKSEEVTATMARHDRDASEFQRYEQRSASRIDRLAAEKGIDVSSVRDNRFRLLGERMGAEKRGDRAGMFRADALLGYNNAQGLEKVGANREEIEEAERKANEAKERYLKEREFQAVQEGRRSGLSDGALREHVDAARSRASEELEEERQKLRKSNGLPDMPRSELLKCSADWMTDRSRERASSSALAETTRLSAKGNHDAEVLRADEQAAQRGPKEADPFAAAPHAKDAALDAVKGLKGVTSDRTQPGELAVASQSVPNDQKAAGAIKA